MKACYSVNEINDGKIENQWKETRSLHCVQSSSIIPWCRWDQVKNVVGYKSKRDRFIFIHSTCSYYFYWSNKGEIHLLLLGILICWLSAKINVWCFELRWDLCFSVETGECWCIGLILVGLPEKLEIRYRNWTCVINRKIQITFSKIFKAIEQLVNMNWEIKRIFIVNYFL